MTYAAPEGDTFAGINGVIEVRGWNYHPGPDMDSYHAKHPNQPNVGTEQASTTGTRGIYEKDAARGYVAAYDEPPHQWAQTAETWWSWFADRPWLSRRFRLDRFRLSRRADAVLVAVHQLALRHSRYVRFSEGQFLLLQIVVDDGRRAAPAAALELARQGRPGNPRGRVEQLQGRWNFS